MVLPPPPPFPAKGGKGRRNPSGPNSELTSTLESSNPCYPKTLNYNDERLAPTLRVGAIRLTREREARAASLRRPARRFFRT